MHVLQWVETGAVPQMEQVSRGAKTKVLFLVPLVIIEICCFRTAKTLNVHLSGHPVFSLSCDRLWRGGGGRGGHMNHRMGLMHRRGKGEWEHPHISYTCQLEERERERESERNGRKRKGEGEKREREEVKSRQR